MKKISIFIILMCISLIANSQLTNISYSPYASEKTPMALGLRIGDSELTGNLGAEFQISHYSISAGWRYYTIGPIPFSSYGEIHVNSYGLALSIYSNPWYMSGVYLTVGETTNGYPYKDLDGTVKSINSTIVMAGYKVRLNDIFKEHCDRFCVNAGLGGEFSSKGSTLVFEFVLNCWIFNQ